MVQQALTLDDADDEHPYFNNVVTKILEKTSTESANWDPVRDSFLEKWDPVNNKPYIRTQAARKRQTTICGELARDFAKNEPRLFTGLDRQGVTNALLAFSQRWLWNYRRNEKDRMERIKKKKDKKGKAKVGESRNEKDQEPKAKKPKTKTKPAKKVKTEAASTSPTSTNPSPQPAIPPQGKDNMTPATATTSHRGKHFDVWCDGRTLTFGLKDVADACQPPLDVDEVLSDLQPDTFMACVCAEFDQRADLLEAQWHRPGEESPQILSSPIKVRSVLRQITSGLAKDRPIRLVPKLPPSSTGSSNHPVTIVPDSSGTSPTDHGRKRKRTKEVEGQ